MKIKFLFGCILFSAHLCGQQLTYVPDDHFEQELIDTGFDDVLDDYGLIEAYTDLSGSGDEGTTTSDTDKDYGLHQFSDPKYVPAYTDKSFQTAADKTGIGKNVKTTQSGTPNKAKGKAITAKISPEVTVKDGVSAQVESVGMKYARKFYQGETHNV